MVNTTDERSSGWNRKAYYFVTVDAETDHIAEGIRTLSSLREQVESEQGIEIPIVWFVRFQRSWNEYVTIDSPAYFTGPMTKGFDGFEMAKLQLRGLRDRGDEIGWHYHAYSYVHRDDLSHERKVAILRADLAACGAEIHRRHPEFEIRSLRFGWFFIPDYGLFTVLKDLGIEVDASVKPGEAGKPVAIFNARYLPPITYYPQKIDGIWFVPFSRTSLIHDYQVVPHDLEWTRLDELQAAGNRDAFMGKLSTTARELREAGATFLTYQTTFATNRG